jgi:hypothetical protein
MKAILAVLSVASAGALYAWSLRASKRVRRLYVA